ncbi:RHS repeat-associated core domain-containing protein [Burkholderia pseudomallei]|nr:RHS repeat-associated core domain-containing protein [Burkholderia pseudomallei]
MRRRNSRLGKNHLDQGGCAFVSGLQTGTTSRETALRYDGRASGATVYVYLGGIPVANLDTQGTTTSVAYVTSDQVGAPRAIADDSGNTVWSWAYQGNVWGEQTPVSNGYTYNLRFPGQYFDAEAGLHYNSQRDYDSATGRYWQVDPIRFKGGQWSL